MTGIVMLMPEAHRLRAFSPEAMERLSACGTVRIAPTATDHADVGVRTLLADAEIVVTGTGTAKLDPSTLDAAPRLRAIVHAAGTVRPIVDIDVYDRGISISSQAPTNALPVAEYTLAMILLELKGVLEIQSVYRRQRAEVDVDALLAGRGVYGARVGIVSASLIGRRMFELLRPFDVEVLVYDPFLSADDAAALGATKVDLHTLFRASDVVSVHAPLLAETRGMIGAPELALLRDGSSLVNTSRGAIIDQPALVRELQTGRFRAVIDVTDPETPAADSPLWQLPNVVLTPHVAGSRGREVRRIGDEVVCEVERLVRGERLRFGVERSRYATTA
jgi:phosphoglycerate dehydrogenase-like enzyme